jgi:hypothetical protein
VEISAAIVEELAYESYSSDASWMGDFAEQHSNGDIGDTTATTIVQQRQGKTKPPSQVDFNPLL